MNKHHLAFVSGIIGFGMVLGQFQARAALQTWTLVVTGDIIPARSVNYKMTSKNNFLWSVWHIASLLQSGDMTLINLEAPLIANCPVTNSGMVFCGSKRFVSGLVAAGVDVANLANNHSLNYGWDGIGQTETLLAGNDIVTTGYTTRGECAKVSGFCSKKVIKEIKNVKVGFLGYSIVGVLVDREALAFDISSFDADVDVLVVSIHWGAEYSRVPRGTPDDPVEIGHLAVENGADVIIGNHPHWIQGMEYYNSKPIFYALGNTIFDQEWSKDTKEGVIVKLTFEGDTFKGYELYPIRIHDYGQPKFLDGQEKQEVLEVFENASELLQP